MIQPLLDFIGDARYEISISYSGRFKPYNANVRRNGRRVEFSLSSDWKQVSDEIVLGLLQFLAVKVLKLGNRPSTSIDLYNNFVRSLHLSRPRASSDSLLEGCFARVNERYFGGLLEMPNFAWHTSTRRLASYDYHTDTISVSDVFRGRDDLLDYLVYHELLHKKLKFSSTKVGRTAHHGRKFRLLEGSFENHDYLERQIQAVIRQWLSSRR